MTPGQLVSIGIFVAGALLFWMLPRKTPPPADLPKAPVPDKA
jgi:hypothetical protein